MVVCLIVEEMSSRCWTRSWWSFVTIYLMIFALVTFVICAQICCHDDVELIRIWRAT